MTARGKAARDLGRPLPRGAKGSEAGGHGLQPPAFSDCSPHGGTEPRCPPRCLVVSLPTEVGTSGRHTCSESLSTLLCFILKQLRTYKRASKTTKRFRVSSPASPGAAQPRGNDQERGKEGNAGSAILTPLESPSKTARCHAGPSPRSGSHATLRCHSFSEAGPFVTPSCVGHPPMSGSVHASRLVLTIWSVRRLLLSPRH